MSALTSKLLWPTGTKAVTASGVVHASALTALVALGWVARTPIERPEIAGTVAALQLQATFSPPEPPRPLETSPLEMRVLVMPEQVQIGAQRFVQTDSHLQRPELVEMVVVARGELPPLALGAPRRKARAEVATPPAPVETPAKRVAVAAPPQVSVVTLPQAPGTHDKTPPRFFNNQPHIYPAEAIRQRLEGETLLQVTISATGYVTDVAIARSSGHAILDAAAASAVRTWRAEPALQAGQPIPTTEFLPVRFRLPR